MANVIDHPTLTKIRDAQDQAIAWSVYPHLFANRASGGRWKKYKHLEYISNRIAPAIARGGARFIVTCPPRHGKSELISNWLPTWFLYLFTEKKIILASYAAEFASKWGGQVRQNLTENPLIQTELSKSTKSKKQFQTLLGGQMICAGMGGPITGSGADLFIIDDPLKNYQEAMSPLIREAHKDWFKTVALTRLEPNASIIILMTRWHEDDLGGYVLDEKNLDKNSLKEKFQLINLPSLCESEDDPLGRPIGEALCPERYDKHDLEVIKANLGEMHFAAMYQQRPAAKEGNIVQKSWVKYYRELPPYMDEYAIFADLSYKEGPKTDFTVVECWARKGPNIYLIDQIRARMGFPEQIEAIRAMAKKYPKAVMKQIEEHANGAAVIQVLTREIMGIVPIKPMTGKEARLATISPIYQAGNVHYPDPNYHAWVNENLSELITFPNATHDDTVDVACYAVTHFSKMHTSVDLLKALNKW